MRCCGIVLPRISTWKTSMRSALTVASQLPICLCSRGIGDAWVFKELRTRKSDSERPLDHGRMLQALFVKTSGMVGLMSPVTFPGWRQAICCPITFLPHRRMTLAGTEDPDTLSQPTKSWETMRMSRWHTAEWADLESMAQRTVS